MTKRDTINSLFIFLFAAQFSGCALRGERADIKKGSPSGGCGMFAPTRVEILPLTGLVKAKETGPATINVYICLEDVFGCQQKWPAIFRFELYERVARSAEPKGKRVRMWPDIDLNNPEDNNRYWTDFLRAYKFNLEFEKTSNADFILNATCLLGDGRRLSEQTTIKELAK